MAGVNYQIRLSVELLDRLHRESSRRALRTGDFVRYVLAEAVSQDEGPHPATAEEVRRKPIAAGIDNE
jgi:hypothetical protein